MATTTYTREQLQAIAEKRRRERIQAALDRDVEKSYGDWDALWSEVAIVGNPTDQIDNFLRYGYIPQPKQLRFHKAAREADRADAFNEIAFGGARGGGKTHAIFAQIVLDDTQRQPGLKSLFLRYAKGKAKEQFDDLVSEVLRHVPKTIYDWSSHSGVLKIFGGRVIVGHFKNASDIANYLGLQYDEIGVEECTQLEWRFYKSVLDANRTSKENWRPRAYNSTNPGGIGHNWYKKRFILPQRDSSLDEGNTTFIQSTVEDNSFLDDDYTRKLDENVGWKYRAHRKGDWDIAAGQYFENWRNEIHNIEAFSPPADWDYWLSIDIGYAHWNMVYLHCVSGDGVIYTIDELAHRRTFADEIAPDVLDMLARWELVPDDLVGIYAGSDAFSVNAQSGTEQSVAEQYEAYGLELDRAMTEPGSRVEGARLMTRMLGDPERGRPPTWFVFGANCPKLVECIPAMVHNPNKPDDVLKVDADVDTGEGGDDPYDAVRYGLRRPDRSRLQIVSSGKRRNVWES